MTIKLDKVKQLLTKLADGEQVSLRDIEFTLGKSGVSEYERRWSNELDQRKQFEEKPEILVRYEEKLKKAEFADNKAEGIKTIGKRSKKDGLGRNSRQRLRDSAEKQYELALEYLEEVVNKEPDLVFWFDREIEFGFNSKLSIDIVGMPRLITSRSKYKLTSGLLAQRTKSEIKQEVLEEAKDALEHEIACVATTIDAELLKSKLTKLKKMSRD